jgi:hypothetical protein
MTTQSAMGGPSLDPVDAVPSDIGRAEDVWCLPTTIAEPPVEQFIRDAIRVFEQTGRNPRAYRMELRHENPRGNDVPLLGAAFETSIVFIPRQQADLYPVRVRAKHPCAVSWLLDPDELTAWQRRVLRRAQELTGEAWKQLGTEGLMDVEVQESRDAVAIQLWRTGHAGQSPDNVEILVVLNKEDLEPVATSAPPPLEPDRDRPESD